MLGIITRGWKGLQNNLKKKADINATYKMYGIGWFGKKILKHESSSVIRQHKSEGLNVYYTNGSELLHGLEEVFIEEIYKSNMSTSPYIIDGGANIGLSVLYFLREYPLATIEAFEPDSQNFELLLKNTSNISNNLVLHKEALWKENGFVSFSGSGSMSSKITNKVDPVSEKVVSKRLRDLLNRKVDFLKLDIEGAEYEVVIDIEDKLHFVDQLFLEYHGNFEETYKLSNIMGIMNKSGFKCYIKEAAAVHEYPFNRSSQKKSFDVQLNMFFFR